MEQQIERDPRTDDLRHVAGDNADFRRQPQKQGHGFRVRIPASLGQISLRDNAELRRQRLQEDRREVGKEDHRQQTIGKEGPAADVRCPVAGVHVADRDQVTRPEER